MNKTISRVAFHPATRSGYQIIQRDLSKGKNQSESPLLISAGFGGSMPPRTADMKGMSLEIYTYIN
ncbi:hypothetical protein J6590_081321 [Homalodisca vitripennis]|nr:hypothetical protein J6590_081321 [Homalodisca vitripennis]